MCGLQSNTLHTFSKDSSAPLPPCRAICGEAGYLVGQEILALRDVNIEDVLGASMGWCSDLGDQTSLGIEPAMNVCLPWPFWLKPW